MTTTISTPRPKLRKPRPRAVKKTPVGIGHWKEFIVILAGLILSGVVAGLIWYGGVSERVMDHQARIVLMESRLDEVRQTIPAQSTTLQNIDRRLIDITTAITTLSTKLDEHMQGGAKK